MREGTRMKDIRTKRCNMSSIAVKNTSVNAIYLCRTSLDAVQSSDGCQCYQTGGIELVWTW